MRKTLTKNAMTGIDICRMMKRRLKENQGDLKYDVKWTTLAEYLAYLEKKGLIDPSVDEQVDAEIAEIREARRTGGRRTRSE